MKERYIPEKLQQGDILRVVTPSWPRSVISNDVIRQAEQTLGSMGLMVTYGDHVDESDSFRSYSLFRQELRIYTKHF